MLQVVQGLKVVGEILKSFVCFLVICLHMAQNFLLLFFYIMPVVGRHACGLMVELLLSSAGELFSA